MPFAYKITYKFSKIVIEFTFGITKLCKYLFGEILLNYLQ